MNKKDAVTSALTYFKLAKIAAIRWWIREPFRDAAIISYYTIFSLPGLLAIIVFLAGKLFGQEALVGDISQQFESLIGADVADFIESIIVSARLGDGSVWATIISISTLIFGATGVFYQLQKTLNDIWHIEPNPKNMLLKLVLDRMLAFGVIITVGFFLITSLVASALLNLVSQWLASRLFEEITILFGVVDIMLSFAVLTCVFSAIYRMLPDGSVKWTYALKGGAITSLLFVIVKFGLAYYFTHSEPASTYGAASSVVLLMIWVTYTSLILLYGAELTHTFAEHSKEKPVLEPYAKQASTHQ